MNIQILGNFLTTTEDKKLLTITKFLIENKCKLLIIQSTKVIINVRVSILSKK